MKKAGWLLIGCVITCPVTIWIVRQLDASKARPPEFQPVTVVPAVDPVVEPERPWIEPVGQPPGGGWLIDAQYKYRGRNLDCWVEFEAGGVRRVISPRSQHLAYWYVDKKGGVPASEREPSEGWIRTTVAKPMENRQCVINVKIANFEYLEAIPFERRWCPTSEYHYRNAKTSPQPGATVLLCEYITEKRVNPFADDIYPLVRAHYKLCGQFGSGVDRKSPTSQLRVPAALTAAWMIGAGSECQFAPVSVAVPYCEWVESYASYARLRVYARFLSDAEVEKVRAMAAASKDRIDEDAKRTVQQLIESFRSPPEE